MKKLITMIFALCLIFTTGCASYQMMTEQEAKDMLKKAAESHLQVKHKCNRAPTEPKFNQNVTKKVQSFIQDVESKISDLSMEDQKLIGQARYIIKQGDRDKLFDMVTKNEDGVFFLPIKNKKQFGFWFILATTAFHYSNNSDCCERLKIQEKILSSLPPVGKSMFLAAHYLLLDRYPEQYRCVNPQEG